MTSTYLGYEIYANNLPKSLQRVAAEPINKNAKTYYDANIGKVTSVDDFVNNYKLFSYAMQAYGLEDMNYAKGMMKKVLTSDLSDPNSFVNKLTDPRYKAFAEAFSFLSSGKVPTTSIQSSDQQNATVAAFEANAGGLPTNVSQAATEYYESKIGTIGSFSALEQDPKLYSYVLTAYGLDASTPQSTVESIIEGGVSNTKSAVNTTPGAGYLALHDAFNADSSGAAEASDGSAQSQAQIQATVVAYGQTVKSDTTSQNNAKTATNYYTTAIANVTSADDLVDDPQLMAYVIKSYGLP